MKDIKVIFTDIDGTLRNDKSEISDSCLKALRTLEKNGIQVILTTGRSYSYTKELQEYLKVSPIIISGNGAFVKDTKTNTIILDKRIPVDVIQKVYEYTSTHQCNLFAHEELKDYLIENKEQINDKIISLTVKSNNFERMRIMKSYFKDHISGVEFVNTSKSVILNRYRTNHIFYHDLATSQVSKGNAILEVLDYLKLKTENALCIGDSDNDASMALVLEHSVAMGNATPKMREACSTTISSNNEDGAGKFLWEMIDNLKLEK